MNMKRIVWILSALLFLGGLVLALVLGFRQVSGEGLYSDPAALRPVSVREWEEFNTLNPEHKPVNPALWQSVTLTTESANRVVLTHSLGDPPNGSFYVQSRHDIQANEKLEMDGGAFGLKAIGVALRYPRHKDDDPPEYRVFDSGLAELSEEQISDLRRQNLWAGSGTYSYQNAGGALEFVLEHREWPGVSIKAWNFFDARTRKRLSSGGVWNTSGGSTQFSTSLPTMWHSGPVDLVVDVAYGAPTVFEFPPEPGEGFTYGDLDCRLVTVVGESGFSFWSEGQGRAKLRFGGDGESSRGAGYVFFFQPTAANLPVDFEFLNSEGKVLSGSGSSTSGYVTCIHTNQPRERVARIRAKCATHVRRVVIHLPSLPGLPEANRNVTNLFDVRIPFVRFKDTNEIRNFLGRTLQMETSTIGSQPARATPRVIFPAEFQDASIRDIARFYARAEGGYLRIDKANNRLCLVRRAPRFDKLFRLLGIRGRL